MNGLRKIEWWAVASSLVWTCVCAGGDSSDNIKQEVRSSLASLQNIIVVYKVSTTYTPPQKDVERLKQMQMKDDRESVSTTVTILSGTDKRETVFSFLHGKARYEKTSLERNYEGELGGFPELEIQAFPGQAAETLQKDPSGQYRGVITERVLLPDAEVEVGLGLRGVGQNSWGVDSLLSEMLVTGLDDKTALLEYVDLKGVKHRWTVNRELGCVSTSYERILTKRNNKLNHTMIMEDFRKMGSLVLPYRMTLLTLNTPGEEPPLLIEQEIEVIEYKLNDPQNTEEHYHIKWPQGTMVQDRILNAAYISDGSGLQPQGYINREILDPESTLLNPVAGSADKEFFIPKAQPSHEKDQPFILDLASAKLLGIPTNSEFCSEKTHRYLIESGKGDLAWDDSLITVRKSKALTISDELHRPLKCNPGRWCNWDELPDKVDLPYSVLVVTNEDVDYLITVRKIETDGIIIAYRRLVSDEAKHYFTTRKKNE